MDANHDTTPHSGGPDDFDLIINNLEYSTEDPYLTEIHQEARRCNELLLDSSATGLDEQIKYTDYLDKKWRYMGQSIVITGNALLRLPGNTNMTPYMCIEQKAISNGFDFYLNEDEKTSEPTAGVGHSFYIETAEGRRLKAFIPLDTLVRLDLPQPSPEARARRFAYRYADDARRIDELTKAAIREDQILVGFKGFHMDVDVSDNNESETIADGSEYIRQRAAIEPRASYRVRINGEVIVVEENGDGTAKLVDEPIALTLGINDVILRIADVAATVAEGRQRFVPYIDATAFLDSGKNADLLIPCTSIASIYSTRYGSEPKR